MLFRWWLLLWLAAVAAHSQDRPRLRSGGPGHFVLQFRSYPADAVRVQLAGRGIRVVGFLPPSSLIVSADRSVGLDGLDLQSARSIPAADKMSPVLDQDTPAAYLVTFHGDVEPAHARELALSAGFDLLENSVLLPGDLMLAGPAARVAALAGRDEVAHILPASPDLVAGAPVLACGGAYAEAGLVADYVSVGRGWPKDSAGTVTVRYFLESFTSKVEESLVRGEIERAFREWAKYGNFTLEPGMDPAAARNIAVRFARRSHGDSYPFDGPGGVLGHTFYPSPPNPEPLAGDIHFDADENWHVGSAVDLFTVALHETGHALGLGHSDQPGAVMYPYYRFAEGLNSDDVAGIRALYGSAVTTRPTTVPPDVPGPTVPAGPAGPTVPDPPAGKDTMPPSLRILSPAATIVSTSAGSIRLTGTAADNVGVAAVKWTTSNGDAGTAAGGAAWSATVPLLVGNTVVSVRAWDAAGNSGWRSITVVRH